MGGWSRRLNDLAAFAYGRWRPILAGAFALVGALPFLFWSLELDTDSSRLVPPGDPLATASRENRELFGEPNPLLLRLSFPGGLSNVADELVSRFVTDVSQWDDIAAVGAGLDRVAGTGGGHLLLRAALLSADEGTFSGFLERFQEHGMRRQLVLSRRALVAVDDPDLRRQIAADLLGLREYLPRESMAVDKKAGMFRWEGENHRLVLVLPKGSAEDGAYCRDLIQRLEEEASRLGKSVEGAGRVGLSVTGVHAITGESIGVLREDLVRMTILAGLLLVLLLVTALRSLKAVLCCFLPLVASLAGVTLLARVLFQPLNVLTVGFAAVVLGLGLDFSLHMVTRYLRYAESGDRLTALSATYADCGPPVVIGAASTSVAFLSLLVVGHPGLSQFGVLVSVGLLVTLAITLLTVPALVRWLGPGGVSSAGAVTGQTRGLSWMTLGAMHPAVSAGVALLVVVAGLLMARSFHLEMDIFHLASENLPSVQTAKELESEGLLGSTSTIQVRLGGSDLSQLADAQKELDQELERLLEEGVIVGFDSPSLFLPRVQEEGAARSRLDRAAAAVKDGRDDFFRLVGELGYRGGPHLDAYYRTVEAAVTPPLALSDPWLAAEELDPRTARLVAPGDRVSFLLTTLWPATGTKDRGALGSAEEEMVLTAVDDLELPEGVDLAVTGTALLYQRVNVLLRDGFPRAFVVGLALVFGMILLFFRRVSRTIAALVPLLAALAATLGVATGIGVAISPITLPFAAVVLGIGIDDAVHLLARAPGWGPTSLLPAVREIGPVITLTTLSSAIGFGALAISRLAVVSSLGIVVAMGILACWFFSLFLLPGVVELLERPGRSFRSLALLTLLVVTSVVLGAAPGAEPDAPSENSVPERQAMEILEGIAERARVMEAVSCAFRQTKTIEQLEGDVILEGTLLFQPPRSFRIEVEGDETYLLLCDGESVWLVDRELQITDEVPLDQAMSQRDLARLLPPFLAETPEDLLGRFEAVHSGRQESRDLITLTPKQSTSRAYNEIRLEVDGRFRVRRAIIRYVNGDRVDTLFDSWRRLSAIPVHRFRPSAEELSWPPR